MQNGEFLNSINNTSKTGYTNAQNMRCIMIRQVATVIIFTFAALTARSDETPDIQSASVIQGLIDAAQPGDEVLVPAGEYHGVIQLRERITLVGAGDAITRLDGGGAEVVVRLEKEAAIIGFTIRNGQVLASNQGNYIGIFECTFEDYQRYGILFQGGSGVVAHNILRGNGQSTAIFSHSANPLIINNLIENNQVGFEWHFHLIPSLIGNLFRNNTVAVSGAAGATIVMRGNLFDGNATLTSFGPLPEGNEARPVSAGEFIVTRGNAISGYRELMDTAYGEAVKDHPIIIYDLQNELGSFDAITLFPWASFVVSASAIDTRIANFEAYDWVADRPLQASYFQLNNVRPSVRVDNPELVEKMRERYVLENRYIHPASYFEEENGRRIFRRMTNLSQIEVITPAGYRVVASTPEAIQHTIANRTYLSIHDMGNTDVEIIMEPMSSP